jgi:hypothetical protein
VLEANGQLSWFTSDGSSGFAELIRVYTVSGTSLSLQGSAYGSLYFPHYYWGSGPGFQKVAGQDILYTSSQNGSGAAYVNKLNKDTSYTPNRWKIAYNLAASNTQSGSVPIKIYSTSPSTRIALVNCVSAGLSGSGYGISFFKDTGTSFLQSSISFLVSGGSALGRFATGMTSEDAIHINSAGDIFIPYTDQVSGKLTLMRLGLAQV